MSPYRQADRKTRPTRQSGFLVVVPSGLLLSRGR